MHTITRPTPGFALLLALAVLASPAVAQHTGGERIPAPREGTRVNDQGSVNSHTLQGTVTGLNGEVILAVAGGGLFPLTKNGAFSGTTATAGNGEPVVTVKAQPNGQLCTVHGQVTSVYRATTSVTVTCVAHAVTSGANRGLGSGYPLSGVAGGLKGPIVLTDGLDTITVSSSSGFTFPTALANGTSYTVTLVSASNGQSCPVTYGTGTMVAGGVSSVQVHCSTTTAPPPTATPPTYTIGGTVSGASGPLTLANGAVSLAVSGSGSFTLATGVATGASYNVTVVVAPAGQTCTVGNGAGTVASANVTSIAVQCAKTPLYTLGGSVSGLTGTLVLANGTASLSIGGNGTFAFPTALPANSPYAVTVTQQPAGQTCTVGNGTGTVTSANVTSVAVLCKTNATYTLGGTVSGLTGTLTVANGTASLTIGGNGTFAFPTALPASSPYAVTVTQQPAGQTCTIGNGTGTVTSANVTSVAITCAGTSRTLGGTVSGLSGSLTLASGSANVTVTGPGPFTFPTAIAQGASYAVSVVMAPVAQSCTVSNGSGTVGAGNVTNVAVSCSAKPTFTVGGTVSGLPSGSTLTLADNGSDLLTVTGSGAFTFRTAVLSGSPYAATVNTAPKGVACTVSNGSGSVGSANVTSIAVSCTPPGFTWTWMSGASTGYAPTSYPAPGGTSPTGPGARVNPVSWTDSQGNVWLFGGGGRDSYGNGAESNDLWKFNPATATWTFVGGSPAQNAPGTYGTQGQSAPGLMPGGRDSAATVVDAQGNVWLFGGEGFDSTTGNFFTSNGAMLNDLWKFNPATGQWTWISGSKTGGAAGVYGTRGQAAPGNAPGGRFGAQLWVDGNGNLWLFGGSGLDSSGLGTGPLNDLWMFTPSTGLWTYVKGATVAGQGGTCNTQGVASGSGSPGARFYGGGAADAAGNLWLFGGAGYDCTGNMNNLADLWKFNPATSQWTFVSGTSQVGAAGVYGTQNVPAAGNQPGARYGAAVFTDAAGNLRVFGGYGVDGAGNNGELNDLWQYNAPLGQWSWSGGSSTANAKGVVGTVGTATPGSTPGGRDGMSWARDGAGKLWVFGGGGIDSTGSAALLNDLWQLAP